MVLNIQGTTLNGEGGGVSGGNECGLHPNGTILWFRNDELL